MPETPAVLPSPPLRVQSIDAYRGLVMFLMMAEVLHLPAVAESFPDRAVWRWIGLGTSHVDWGGCSLHDLIQPSFSFLVGVALPYSLASRLARGQSLGWMSLHAAWRAVILVCLGIFLRSIGQPQTNFIFTDTLSQIGLGYLPLFLLGLCGGRWQWVGLVTILIAYWTAFALYPLPPANFDYTAVGVPATWPCHAEGFAAHWNKNSNLGWAFDVWFLNLFPRAERFAFNLGGYLTLSFIPTLATMILGLIAGGWLRDESPPVRKRGRFILMGIASLALGLAIDRLGLCPSVKRIWTPSWVLVSGGWCFLLLAAFHGVVDVLGWRAWSFPLRVIGANSIVAYAMADPFEHFVIGSFHTHVGERPFGVLGETYEPLLTGATVLLVYWLILYWLYRKKIFVRI